MKPTKIITVNKKTTVPRAVKDANWTPEKVQKFNTWTPEQVDKLWKGIEKKQYDDKVAKDQVLHHLKQLKAEIGKYWRRTNWSTAEGNEVQIQTLRAINEMIDKKIAKIKNL